MSDTTDRLSRASAGMDSAQQRLDLELKQFEHEEQCWGDATPETLRRLVLATSGHSRALRELFLASLEAPVVEAPAEQPAKPPTYVADGKCYRVLRAGAKESGDNEIVGAIDRLHDFKGTEEDVRLIAYHLRMRGEYESAAALLRNVEG